jgi:hypothetical protein
MRERRLRTQIHKHSRDAVSATVLGDGPAFDVLRMAASIAFDQVRAKNTCGAIVMIRAATVGLSQVQ